MIVYEHPLSERVRTLLRLEHLFDRIDYFQVKNDGPEHHVALLLIFEILEVASRADLKSDLLQELERQKQTLEALRDNPDISEEALDNVLWQIDQASARLYQASGKVGQELRENEWLMSIKQRTGIPGGVCEFDCRPTTTGCSNPLTSVVMIYSNGWRLSCPHAMRSASCCDCSAKAARPPRKRHTRASTSK